jgi:hypothetical protein
LRSLELARALTADQDHERQRQIARAITSLRETIADLRSVTEPESNPTAAGFVLANQPTPGNDQQLGGSASR